MKIVKESLLEKFQEDSDPIEDMGIGIDHIIKDAKQKLYAAFEKIKKEDGGYEFLEDVHKNNWANSNFIETIFIQDDQLIFSFYYAYDKGKDYPYRAVNNPSKHIMGKERIEYAKRYITEANLNNVIDMNNISIYNHESFISFQIKTKYLQNFRKYWKESKTL